MALNQIDQLVYVSRSLITADKTEVALNDIARIAHSLNRQNQITGALVLIDGYFIQLLEGAPAALDLLMIHLEFDVRHTDIQVVARETVSQRAIPDWGMIAPPAGHRLPPQFVQLLQKRPTSLAPWRETMVETVMA